MPQPTPALPEGMTKRGRTYFADFQVAGRRTRRRLSTNLTTARQLLTELRARAERGDYGLLDNDVSLAELRGQYLGYCRQTLKPATVQRYEFNLAAILPHLPPRVSQITVDAVVAYRKQRLAGASPRTVNSDVQAVSIMLNWAVENGIIASNPLKRLKPLRHDHPKEGRALDDAEVKRLLEASTQRWADVWYAFLVTGMREGELIALRLADIDWETRELTVRRGIAKNHRPRRIPIDRELWDLLCQRREEDDPEAHAFPRRQGGGLSRNTVYQAFVNCCRKAGIQIRREGPEGQVEHVDVHSLRRTFATNLIVHRTDPKTVQELMGHRTLAMTMNLYAKINVDTKREAIGRLSYGAGPETPAVLKLGASS